MEHPTVTAARERLNELKGRWPEIADASGVSYSWLQKFARAEITNPTIDTLQAVVNACSAVATAVVIKVA